MPYDIVFEAIVYPGIMFLGLVVWLTQWYHRKVYARMQNRIGPLHTGPIGILQPIADYIKLFFKEDISTEGSSPKLTVALLSIAIGSLVTLTLMLPIVPFRPIAADYDVMLAMYLLVWPTIAIALIGLLTPNPFSAIGSSRVFSMTLAYEVTFVAATLTPIILSSRLHNSNYSLYYSSLNAWKLWLNPYTVVPMILALIAVLLSLQCKLLLKPFDIPEAETEVVAGPFTEYSGFKLALILGLHDVEMVVGSLLITMLFFGGLAPLAWLPWYVALIIVVAEYVIVVTVLTWIKAITARLRIDQALTIFWKYILPMAVAALVLSVLLPSSVI
ncbi:MAG: complex I subunit 1 family protein [Nitrososphaerota archaeon]|nr:NADH-quinone oxidoreductase subunit H [Candidatus Nezhaarchaeota archaeon]MDW8050701.1 complex I subunit 1 family protein [Nitrososphaerota archaeon]